jgi:hypothetical protein
LQNTVGEEENEKIDFQLGIQLMLTKINSTIGMKKIIIYKMTTHISSLLYEVKFVTLLSLSSKLNFLLQYIIRGGILMWIDTVLKSYTMRFII